MSRVESHLFAPGACELGIALGMPSRILRFSGRTGQVYWGKPPYVCKGLQRSAEFRLHTTEERDCHG